MHWLIVHATLPNLAAVAALLSALAWIGSAVTSADYLTKISGTGDPRLDAATALKRQAALNGSAAFLAAVAAACAAWLLRQP